MTLSFDTKYKGANKFHVSKSEGVLRIARVTALRKNEMPKKCCVSEDDEPYVSYLRVNISRHVAINTILTLSTIISP